MTLSTSYLGKYGIIVYNSPSGCFSGNRIVTDGFDTNATTLRPMQARNAKLENPPVSSCQLHNAA